MHWLVSRFSHKFASGPTAWKDFLITKNNSLPFFWCNWWFAGLFVVLVEATILGLFSKTTQRQIQAGVHVWMGRAANIFWVLPDDVNFGIPKFPFRTTPKIFYLVFLNCKTAKENRQLDGGDNGLPMNSTKNGNGGNTVESEEVANEPNSSV